MEWDRGRSKGQAACHPLRHGRPPPAVIATVFERDAILLTKAGGPGGAPALAVSSKLPRFGKTYTLTIAPRCLAWWEWCVCLW